MATVDRSTLSYDGEGPLAPMTPPAAAQAKRGLGPGLDLPMLDQIELSRAIERENRGERIVLIGGTAKSCRGPQHFGGHERLERPSASLPVMM